MNNEYQKCILIQKIKKIISQLSKEKGSEDNANMILNNVWLGNWISASELEFLNQSNIKHIINVTKTIPNKYKFIDCTIIPIQDADACEENLMDIIEQGADIINQMVQNDKSILIHCKRGHHRSASVVMCYLMKYHNMSLIDALLLVKIKRPTAFRRISCMMQALITYELNRY